MMIRDDMKMFRYTHDWYCVEYVLHIPSLLDCCCLIIDVDVRYHHYQLVLVLCVDYYYYDLLMDGIHYHYYDVDLLVFLDPYLYYIDIILIGWLI